MTDLALPPPQFHDATQWNSASQMGCIFMGRANAIIPPSRWHKRICQTSSRPRLLAIADGNIALVRRYTL